MLMTAFALIQSLTAGAANQIKRADKDVVRKSKEGGKHDDSVHPLL